MKKMFRWLLALVPALMLQGCFATSQSIAAFTAKVVDADTGSPIEGANVVAVYQTMKPSGIHGWTHGEVLEVMETVTGADGGLAFPKVDLTVPQGHELKGDDPIVLIFKPGYKNESVTRFQPFREPGVLGVAGISGRTVKFRRYTEEEKSGKHFSYYSSLDTHLEPIIDECKSENIKNMLASTTQERRRLSEQYPSALIYLPPLDDSRWASERLIKHCPASNPSIIQFILGRAEK